MDVLIIFLLGGAVATGLFEGVRWREVVVALVVLLVVGSIIVHGVTATPVMRFLDRKRKVVTSP